MTEEEKELLLKDLCARLVYGVVVEYTAGDGSATIDCHIDCISIRSQCVGIMDNPDKPFVWRDIISIKPYLRPMSSMTEEERKEYKHLVAFSGSSYGAADFVDWLNKKMFAYRNIDGKDMFELGLAIEAPEDMYK